MVGAWGPRKTKLYYTLRAYGPGIGLPGRISAGETCPVRLESARCPTRNQTSGPLQPRARLNYLTVYKFRIVVETLLYRARIVRTRCVPVCGHRAGYFGRGLASRPRLEIEAGSFKVFGCFLAQQSWGCRLPDTPCNLEGDAVIGASRWRAGGSFPAVSWWARGGPRKIKLYFMLRAGNLASGPAFGRMLIGSASKATHRPAKGRPEGRF